MTFYSNPSVSHKNIFQHACYIVIIYKKIKYNTLKSPNMFILKFLNFPNCLSHLLQYFLFLKQDPIMNPSYLWVLLSLKYFSI